MDSKKRNRELLQLKKLQELFMNKFEKKEARGVSEAFSVFAKSSVTETSKELPKEKEAPKKTPIVHSRKRQNGIQILFLKVFSLIPLQERINFARHLSIDIKSGMPLIEALRLIQRQMQSKNLSKLIEKIIDDVNNGQFLAQSLDRYRYAFGDFFINMVKVGETSGNLSATLLYLSDELKKQKEINHKVRSALIYPLIILIATIGVTLFLTLVIFPKILPIFE